MRFPLWPVISVCALVIACGGESASGRSVDLSKVATATLPATLPEPLVLGEGVAQPGGGSTYTIRSNDTLADIATRFGLTLDELRAANPGVEPGQLIVGQTIRLPAGAEAQPTVEVAPTEPAPTDTPPPADTPTPSSLGQTYVVKDGDIPVTIAAQFGITVEELLAANPGIDPNALRIGQVLIIPPAAPTPEPQPEG